MTKPNPNAYSDIIPLMETALVSPSGIRFRVATWGQAVNLRQRCYQWRKLKREQAAEALGPVPGLVAASPYDNIVIRIEDQLTVAHNKKPESPGPFDLVITERKTPAGVLMDGEGNPIDLPKPHYKGMSLGESPDPEFDDIDSDTEFDLDSLNRSHSPLED